MPPLTVKFHRPGECSAIIDRDGAILAVSGSWITAAGECPNPAVNCGIGHGYLEYCECPEAAHLKIGLRKLLAGETPYFVGVYECGSDHEFLPFALIATPLRPASSGKFFLRHVRLEAHIAEVGSMHTLSEISGLKAVLRTGTLATSTQSASSRGVLDNLFDALDSIRAALDHGVCLLDRPDVYKSLANLVQATAKAIDGVDNHIH